MSGLYIHVPFCKAKCAYCDFYSTPDRSQAQRYVDCLVAELGLRSSEIDSDVATLYIGGGTPTTLPDGQIARILEAVDRRFPLSAMTEVTIEANPDDITSERIAALNALGFNRISIGIQAFDDAMLAELGRRHDCADAVGALDALSSAGMNYSADLIFGLPGQSVEMWEESLSRLLAYRPPHFSAYLLSYERGTRLYARLIAGKVEEADNATVDAMYAALTRRAADAGYHHYEISNYALPGREAVHNSSYWTMTPYLGLGCAAHSFDGSVRRANPSRLKEYIEAIEAGITCYEVDEESTIDRVNDLIMTSLRTSRGLDVDAVAALAGEEVAAAVLADAEGLIAKGLLVRDDEGVFSEEDLKKRRVLRVPEERWLEADTAIRELFR